MDGFFIKILKASFLFSIKLIRECSTWENQLGLHYIDLFPCPCILSVESILRQGTDFGSLLGILLYVQISKLHLEIL